MPPLPDTFVELALAGYRHKGSGRCSACGAFLEWFVTPKLHNMPFSAKREIVVGEDTIRATESSVRIEPHWAACPKAKQFRRKR